jgi:hypothetical protein
MSIFTVVDAGGKKQTYEGFSTCKHDSPLVAIATVDNWLDFWEIDNTTTSVEELERYYRSERGEPDVKIVTYERMQDGQNFRGCEEVECPS